MEVDYHLPSFQSSWIPNFCSDFATLLPQTSCSHTAVFMTKSYSQSRPGKRKLKELEEQYALDVKRPRLSFKIFARFITGRIVDFVFETHSVSVHQLKQMLETEHGIPERLQRLFYHQKLLSDDQIIGVEMNNEEVQVIIALNEKNGYSAVSRHHHVGS